MIPGLTDCIVRKEGTTLNVTLACWTRAQLRQWPISDRWRRWSTTSNAFMMIIASETGRSKVVQWRRGTGRFGLIDLSWWPGWLSSTLASVKRAGVFVARCCTRYLSVTSWQPVWLRDWRATWLHAMQRRNRCNLFFTDLLLLIFCFFLPRVRSDKRSNKSCHFRTFCSSLPVPA